MDAQSLGAKAQEYVGRFLVLKSALLKRAPSEDRDALIAENDLLRDEAMTLSARLDAYSAGTGDDDIVTLGLVGTEFGIRALRHISVAEDFLDMTTDATIGKIGGGTIGLFLVGLGIIYFSRRRR